MKLLRPALLLLTLAALAAVPVAAHATDSHAPKGARGDWLPPDEWAMSQWLPVDAFMVRPYRTTDQQRDYASLVCHLPAPH
jgi:hypothetical protein